MPFPWSKSSSKEAKKKCNSSRAKAEGGVVPKLQYLGRKGQQRFSEDLLDGAAKNGSSRGGSRSSFDSPRLGSSEATTLFSPSAVGTRTPSFAGQPLPLPESSATKYSCLNNGHLPLPTYDQVEFKNEPIDLDGTTSGYGSCSMSSGGSSLSSAEAGDIWLGNANRQFPFSDLQNGHASSLALQQKKRMERNLRQDNAMHQQKTMLLSAIQTKSVSPLRTRAPVKEEKPTMHMNVPARSAPTSLFSSPTHSPRRLSSSEQQALFQKMLPENQQQQQQQGRISPEKSPLASPRRSPRIAHLQSRGSDSPTVGHRLPPPPPNSSSASAFPNSSVNNSAFPTSPIGSPSGVVLRWQKGNLLGCGSFGRVYKGFSDSGTFCAMKEVMVIDDPKSKECVKQLMQEINMLSSLRHPNIVQYLGSEMLEDSLYIYLEFVSGGSIQKVLQEYGAFKEPVIRSYTHQILSGLSYLHSMNKVHRDIKGANILVDTNGEVKLADFGMAKHISANSLVLSFKGSPYWMAPEVFKSTTQSYPVDVWSLGCTIIEMATGKPPWSQYEGVAAMFKIGNSKETPYVPDTLSPVAQEFIRLCLQRNPEDRPTACQLLEHPFVKFSYDEQFCDGLPPASPTFRSVVANLSHDSGPRGQYITSREAQTLSRPLSPIGSPSIHTRSIYSSYGGLTPIITSGTSTPRPSAYDDSPRLPLQQSFTKERLNMVSRVNGMHIDTTTRSEVRFSTTNVSTPTSGNRSPRTTTRSDFVWNPPHPRPSAAAAANDHFVAFSESSRFFGNGHISDRQNSPLRNIDNRKL